MPFERASLQKFLEPQKYIFDLILMKYFKFERINFGLNIARSVSMANTLRL
jgi:hypothetical protein